MRLSTVMAVLFIGALLYVMMAVVRAIAIGRMEGMQDEALDYRRKAVRGVVFAGAVFLACVLTRLW